jgi:hypothetical protein
MIHGSTSGYLTTDGTDFLGDSAGYYFYDRSDPRGPNLTYSDDERKYSLDSFFNKTRAAVRLLGYDVSWGEPENFTFNQTDAWTLQVNMTIAMNFSDPRGWVNVTRRMPLTVAIRIDGFTDPAVLRADLRHRPTDASCGIVCGVPLPFVATNQRPHRNVYRALDANDKPIFEQASDAQAKLKSSSQVTPLAQEGMGFFFGPVSTKTRAQFNSAAYNLSRIRSYIFMTDSPDEARAAAKDFGGLILMKKPGSVDVSWDQMVNGVNCRYTNRTQTDCLFCIRQQFSNDTDLRCPRFNAFITPESIPPANPLIPWIATDGDPTVGVPTTYHYTDSNGNSLAELLISSSINATDMCGPNFNATNPGCSASTPDPVGSRLEMKYADEGAGHSASKAWDLTGPRDMAICGFYVRSAFSPSYGQRFTYFWPQYDTSLTTAGRYSRLNQGIESFVVGRWAGGKDDSCAQEPNVSPPIETHSRLDYQFYADDYYGTQASVCTGPFLRGMPGCKNIADCNNAAGPLQNGTGRFALSNPAFLVQDREVWPTYRYNVTNLTVYTGTNPFSSQCR